MQKRNIKTNFVYLYGPDGAGKTIQARLLTNKLRLKGYKVKRVCIRSNHYPFRAFWNLLKFISGELYRYPDGNVTKIPRISILKSCSALIIYLQLFNVLILVFITHVLLRLGYIIIAERFILDTYVDLVYLVSKFTGKKIPRMASKTLLKFLPKNLLFTFLDADYLSLIRRYKKRNSVFEPEDYIQLQRKIGSIFAQRLFGFTAFTPHNSISNIHSKVLKLTFARHMHIP